MRAVDLKAEGCGATPRLACTFGEKEYMDGPYAVLAVHRPRAVSPISAIGSMSLYGRRQVCYT
jgi:hypothetical protein